METAGAYRSIRHGALLFYMKKDIEIQNVFRAKVSQFGFFSKVSGEKIKHEIINILRV